MVQGFTRRSPDLNTLGTGEVYNPENIAVFFSLLGYQKTFNRPIGLERFQDSINTKKFILMHRKVF